MADTDPAAPKRARPGPGEGPASGAGRLARAPAARFAERADPGISDREARSALRGPFLRAVVVATLGAGALVLVGALLASTAGLLFVAGATGAAIGLVLARAAVPAEGTAPLSRGAVAWLAVGIVLVAVALADLATWTVARGEGGTLGPLDYLLTTFGPFVPGELVLGALGAVWGARSGPVQS